MDSSVSPTHGDQEGSAYNGYFECTCSHPLFLFNQHGDLERAMLRCGNHNSAKFWRRVLLPVIERYRDRDIPKYFRGDAAFAIPALYRVLEEEGFQLSLTFIPYILSTKDLRFDALRTRSMLSGLIIPVIWRER